MRLQAQETERFYRIWFALLHYVNTQLHLVPSFPAAPGEQDASPEVTMQVRDAFWAELRCLLFRLSTVGVLEDREPLPAVPQQPGDLAYCPESVDGRPLGHYR